LKYYIKVEGEELEEITLKYLKYSLSHRYIPNRVFLCLHYLYLKILVSEEDDDNEISTCRKIEKKDRFLNKKNYKNFHKPNIPKIFFEYEKTNQFIEKFYRKNMLKKDKGEIERVVIVNILKILLSTIDNNNSTSNQIEYTKDYIPEILLKYHYVEKGNKITFTIENTNENFYNNTNNNISKSINDNKSNDLNKLNNENQNNNERVNLNSSNYSLNDSNANINNLLVSKDSEKEEDLNYTKNNNDLFNNQNEFNNKNNNFSYQEVESQLLNIELKENIEFGTKAYLEILQNNIKEAEIYIIIDVINKVSLTAIIIYFYYFILKTLQNYDLIQFSYFAFHLFDSNGLLVFLKILSQDFKAIEQQFIDIYETDTISIQFGELIEFILLFDLKLIYKICFKNEEYICKPLIECKLQAMLKKVLNNFPQNEKIKVYCMKLFKIQLKYFDKNWRLENINILTNIYTTLKIKSDGNINTPENPNVGGNAIDNFLKYEKKEKILSNNKEGGFNSDFLFNNEELKKIHLEYHNYNYYKYLNNPDEIEKYKNNLFHSEYAMIYLQLLEKSKLTEEFYINYK